MTAPATVLEVAGLHTWLDAGAGTVRAVDGVDFRIRAGETLCLVGESGSGKSVTALSVIGLLPQGALQRCEGRVDMPSAASPAVPRNLLELSPEAMRRVRGDDIAMIFQEPMSSLNPVFTVGEQIVEALVLQRPELSWREARERAVESLAAVRVDRPAERFRDYPHRLSGGQRQRVMIAMALACEPRLLIADEPTTALDVTVQAGILTLIRELQARTDMAVLFITHDFGVVAEVADDVAVMRAGRIVEQGTLADVLRSARHDYTRELLAAVPENLARARRREGTARASPAAGAGDALLSIERLSVRFPIRAGLLRRTVGHVDAVDGVDLAIGRGEIVALVGESGCGKTTLGHAVVGLTAASGGRVRFDGDDVTRLGRRARQPYRQRLQIVFQDPVASLNPRLTVAQALTEPMAVHGIGADDEERLALAGEVLDEVQLESAHLWRYPHEFSGGQRQRIAIARALVLAPEFIVCDEITSALDVSVQAEVLHLLARLREQRQLTLLFITHDIGVVEYLSDTTAVMYNGRIVEAGPTAEVCSTPGHEYTRKLLASVPRLQAAARDRGRPAGVR